MELVQIEGNYFKTKFLSAINLTRVINFLIPHPKTLHQKELVQLRQTFTHKPLDTKAINFKIDILIIKRQHIYSMPSHVCVFLTYILQYKQIALTYIRSSIIITSAPTSTNRKTYKMYELQFHPIQYRYGLK